MAIQAPFIDFNVGGTRILTLEVKDAPVAANASGDNTIVAAVANHSIRVMQAHIQVAAGVDLYWKDGTGGSAIWGGASHTAPYSADGSDGPAGFILPWSPIGWFQTTSGTLLNLVTSGAVVCTGVVQYIEIPNDGK